MILFTTDSQWKGAVEDGLSQKVAKVYHLEHNLTSANTKNDGDTLIKEGANDIH